ncbi:MAG: hypothetical protein LIP03_02305 [Bacteroidales bacterium]|nr:hypothetical protein [Bacteroidales bacterium]
MDYLEYKGYKGSVEYGAEDDCFFGKVQGLSKECILYEGETLAELRADFEAGVDSYLEYLSIENKSSYDLSMDDLQAGHINTYQSTDDMLSKLGIKN